MTIKRLTPAGAVNQAIEKKILLAKKSMYRALMRIGEECINYARLNGGYIDQTGNLRSSVGYAVIDNGKVVSSKGFVKVKTGTEGVISGKQFLDDIIAKHGGGVCLIVVAGMNYAAYVEAKSYDVISGAELQSEKIAPQLLKQLGFKVS